MDEEIYDVQRCHEKFELPIGRGKDGQPGDPKILEPEAYLKRRDFIQEEFQEFQDAWVQGDLAKLADALVDMVYVIKGTAVMMGITPACWTDLWNEVHWANMQKVKSNIDDYHFGLHKPEGWKPPQIKEILESYAQGDQVK